MYQESQAASFGLISGFSRRRSGARSASDGRVPAVVCLPSGICASCSPTRS